MPAKKADSEAPKKAKTDPQGHPEGPDYIPTEKEYDPAKHNNHSHFNP